MKSIDVSVYHFDKDYIVTLYPANHAPNGKTYHMVKIDGEPHSLDYKDGKWTSKSIIDHRFCEKIGLEIEKIGFAV
jgi:hypothetical protein